MKRRKLNWHRSKVWRGSRYTGQSLYSQRGTESLRNRVSIFPALAIHRRWIWNDFSIDRTKDAFVPLFLAAPPRYSTSRVFVVRRFIGTRYIARFPFISTVCCPEGQRDRSLWRVARAFGIHTPRFRKTRRALLFNELFLSLVKSFHEILFCKNPSGLVSRNCWPF